MLVLQILSVVVIRVGNATGMTLLKGAGQHRFWRRQRRHRVSTRAQHAVDWPLG